MPFPKNEVRKVCMHDTRALLWERSHSRCFGYPSEILSSDLMIAPTPQPSHRSTQRSSTWGSDARRGGTQSASFRDAAGSACAFSSTPNPRVRFSVECAFPHLGKRGGTSRKGAACPGGRSERRTLRSGLTESRSLQPPRRADCAFRSRRRPGGVGRNRPPGCGVPWKRAQLGKCVRATARQAAGGCARVRKPRFGA